LFNVFLGSAKIAGKRPKSGFRGPVAIVTGDFKEAGQWQLILSWSDAWKKAKKRFKQSVDTHKLK